MMVPTDDDFDDCMVAALGCTTLTLIVGGAALAALVVLMSLLVMGAL